jgi:phosphoribosyl 1,2-cyclic phosphodiesterase
MTTKEPYICYGFQFDGISYISDTNYIPPETMGIIQGKSRIFIVDCLRLTIPHASHFSLDQSIEAAKQVKASKTYFVGFTHRVDHYELCDLLNKLEQTDNIRIAPAFDGLRVNVQDPNHFIESSYLDSETTIVNV